MSDSPESFRLPEGFASVRDPVEGNPFPANHSCHRVWENATRAAEEQVYRLNAHYMASYKQDNVDAASWFNALVVEKFNAWAFRNLHGVLSDRDVDHYGPWLNSYANQWIELVSRDAHTPRHILVAQLQVLRNQLGGRVHYWKAEARKYRAEQEAYKSGSDDPAPTAVPYDFAGQDLETSEGRRRAIDAFLEECNRTQSCVILRTHIWKAIGHSHGRGFEHWQAMSGKATGAADLNIRRILMMPIPKFIAQLRDQGHLTDK